MFPDFRFYLKATDTTYYKVMNGNIIIVDEKTEIVNAPKDWRDTGIEFNRDKKYYGIFIEVAEPNQFDGDGATILRYIKANQYYEGVCIFRVERLITNNLTYEMCYEGDLDFSQMHDGIDFVTINCKNRGLQEDLDAQSETTYEIDLNATEALTLNIDGTYTEGSCTWFPGDFSQQVGTPFIPHQVFFETNAYDKVTSLPIYSVGDIEQTSTYIAPQTQSVQVGETDYSGLIDFSYTGNNSDYIVPNSGIYLFKTYVSLKQCKIQGYIPAFIDFVTAPMSGYTATVETRLLVMNNSDPSTPTQNILLRTLTSAPVFPFTDYYTTFNITIDIPSDSFVMIVVRAKKQGADAPFIGDNFHIFYPNDQSYIRMIFLARALPTETKVLRYYHALKQILGKLSVGSNLLSSYFNTAQTDATSRFNNFDTSPYYQCLTSGDGLTNKPNPKIKITWEDIWQDMISRDSLSLSIENNNYVIERLDYVFSNEKLATIESVNDIDWYDFPDNIFNNLKIGFPESDVNTKNGQQESLTTSEYISDVKRYGKSEGKYVTTFIGAPSQIESIRGYTLNQDNATTTNNNDTFILEADPTPTAGKYKLYRPPGSISGITDIVNAYNLTLTAGRAVNRKRAFFRSSIPFGQLTFQTSTKNQNLVSSFFAGIITENANIPLDSDTYLGHTKPRYFLPYLVEFDCVPTVNLLNIVKNNPKGYIEYNHYGNMVGGYIYEMNFKPATNECHLILILRADTNMNLFIR